MSAKTSAPAFAVAVLAGGKGTRMKSTQAKVLHPIAGRPMLHHVLQAAQDSGATRLVVIVGHAHEAVKASLEGVFDTAQCALQTEQLGTGHAVMQTQKALDGFEGDLLILSGDVPLVTPQLIDEVVKAHTSAGNAVTVTTTTVDDPTGLGRIVRKDGAFSRIVEHKDADEATRNIHEINTGIYMVRCPLLFDLLAQVTNNNANGEYYLTDIAALAIEQNLPVGTCHVDDGEALMGVNTRMQLAACEAIYQHRQRHHHMANGATLQDPQTTYFSWDTKVGQDVTIGPNVYFGPGVEVADNVTILPFTHLEGAKLMPHTQAGPFARLRPGAVLEENAHVGNFCEIKKSTLGPRSKMGHLSYIGDCTVAEDVNIGAGTITANYDGTNKFATTIGAGAFIGSHSTLVAPVEIGACGFVAAGSTVIEDVPSEGLAIGRARQVNKAGRSKSKHIKKGA